MEARPTGAQCLGRPGQKPMVCHSLDELLERANRWAIKKGLPTVNRWTVLDWRREGLIPAPAPRGRGGGRGKAECWPTIAYWRILKLTKLQANGWKRRRDQRLRLWLFGSDIDPNLIHQDFIQMSSASTNEMRRRLRPWRWRPPTSLEVLPKSTERGARELLDPAHADGMVKHLGLASNHPFIARLQLPVVAKALQTVLQVATAQFFLADWEVDPALAESAVAQLPPEIQVAVGDDINRFIRDLTGAFVEPDIDENSLIAILERTEPDEILRLRRFMFEWSDLLNAFGRLFTEKEIARELPDAAQVFQATRAGLMLQSPADRAQFILMFLRLQAVDPAMRRLVDGIVEMRLGSVLLTFGQRMLREPPPSAEETEVMLRQADVGEEGLRMLLAGSTG